MKNWQVRLLEGLSGASRAYLKHRRTSKFHYKDKTNPESLKKSVSSYHKSNIVRSAVPTTTSRNVARGIDYNYIDKRRSKFGTKLPDYGERNS